MPNYQKSYQTQWASQFYAAAELTRRGYLVSLTLGNAPVADLLVASQSKQNFTVEVKGQATRNFWLYKKVIPQDDLFYILVYLPGNNERPKFYILTSYEMMEERDNYRHHIETSSGKYRDHTGGMNWSAVLKYEDKWEKLPN